MDVVVFSPAASLCNWKFKRGSFLTYFKKVLMQLKYGFYVEQDECCVVNARNLNLKATKTQNCKLPNLKVFEVRSIKIFEV